MVRHDYSERCLQYKLLDFRNTCKVAFIDLLSLMMCRWIASINLLVSVCKSHTAKTGIISQNSDNRNSDNRKRPKYGKYSCKVKYTSIFISVIRLILMTYKQ